MRWKTFLLGFLLVLAAPFLVIAAFAVWVHAVNAGPSAEPLGTTVHPQVVWPWQDAAYLFTVRSTATDAAPAPPEPIDMAFLIDVSGSMTRSLPAMAQAAHAVARDMAASGDVRFALVRFDTEAEVNTPWTSDPEELGRGLRNLDAFTSQNDTRAAMARLDELAAEARSEARKVAVWYSDGHLVACPPSLCGSVMSEAEILAAGEELRRQRGLEHFAIGLPYTDAHPILTQLTGSPARVFEPADARDLVSAFRSLAETVIAGLGDKGRISVQLDGRHFGTPLEGTGWQQDADGTLRLDAGIRSDRALTYALPLEPRSLGLWRIGLEPARLTYVDEESGSLVEADAAHRPSFLVLTWLALFWALLPAFLWALAHWPRRRPAEEDEPLVLPPVRRLPPPSRLPALPGSVNEPRAAVPTLFVGLGGAGRRALHAIRSELGEAHLGSREAPYRFLAVDVDQREPQTQVSAEGGRPVETLVAPPEVARTASYLPQPGHIPERWTWFDAERYHDAPREDLNMTDGAHGDRSLSRLALFRWLENGDLAAALRRAAEDLARLPSSTGCRQVVILAGRHGGFGGATFLDFGRLTQRLGRDLQAGGLDVSPEVIGILCDDPDNSRPGNREALELELQTAMLTGAWPTRTCYVEGDELLDRVDSETPYHWVLSANGSDLPSVAAQCAATAALLTERRPRQAVLEGAAELDGEPDTGGSPDVTSRVIAARVSSLQVIPTLIREQVHVELLLHVLGPDVLLDVEPAPDGGFAPVSLPENEASRNLDAWTASEPVGTPLAQLLEGVRDPAALPALATTLERAGAGVTDWLCEAVTAAVNRRLRGHRDGSAWHRDWYPAAAAAVLRLLARRLKEGRPAFERAAAGHETRRAWKAVTELAAASAEALERQVDAWCRLAEPVAERRRELAGRAARLEALQGRIVLDGEGSGQEIENWSRQALESWLGSCDTISLLRERIFFGLDGSPGEEPRAVLHVYVAEPAVYSDAEPACRALSGLTRTLASGLPAARLASALACRDPEERSALAARLVNRDHRPQRVVLVTPRAPHPGDGRAPREVRVLEELRGQIPQPADHGLRLEAESTDHSAVRRIELERQVLSPASEPCYVAAAEQEAERLRRRIEGTYRLDVPTLPPVLRLALTRPRAFRSFARAYRAGHIVRRRDDDDGREQWYFRDRDLFLTHGRHGGLAAAAMGYTAGVDDPEDDFTPAEPAGDFSALDTWRQAAGAASDEVLVQAAIDCAS